MTLTLEQRRITAEVANWDAFGNTNYTASDIERIWMDRDIVVVQFANRTQTRIDRQTFREKVREFAEAVELNERQTELVRGCVDSPYKGHLNLQFSQATLELDNGEIFARIWWESGLRPGCYLGKTGWRHSYLCQRQESFSSVSEAIHEVAEAFEATVRDFLQGDCYVYHYLSPEIKKTVRAAAERLLMTAPI